MKDLKKVIIGIIIVFCLLISLKTAHGWEVIVPVSEQSIKVEKFTKKKKEKGEKYYFYCLQTQELRSPPFLHSGIIKTEHKDETPSQVFERVLISSKKSFQCRVVIIEFNRLE